MTDGKTFASEAEGRLWCETYEHFLRNPRKEHSDGSTTVYDPTGMADEAVTEYRKRAAVSKD